jgi:hypothetical protein
VKLCSQRAHNSASSQPTTLHLTRSTRLASSSDRRALFLAPQDFHCK